MRWFSRSLLGYWLLLGLALCPFASYADTPYNMPVGVTPISRDIFDLHMTVFWICVAIGIVVFSIMLYSIIMHRKSKGAKAAQFHENTAVEITWAIIPLIILVIMAIPATKVLIAMEDDSNADMTIKVTGYQWKWKYDYLDQNISFFSNLSTPLDQIDNQNPKDRWYLLDVDHPLVLPIHKKIRFLITSNDVIHSWWVPALGIKKDAIPGFIHEVWARIDEPGTYRGQCAELCGANHGFMPVVVIAKTQADFDQWLTEQKSKHAKAIASESTKMTMTELMTEGEAAYKTNCAACHKPDGSGMPPVFPALKGSKVATGPVAKHIDIVLHGVPGTAMQAFGPQLNDEDLAAIITYERNAWGNNTGDAVQPSAIKAARSNS